MDTKPAGLLERAKFVTERDTKNSAMPLAVDPRDFPLDFTFTPRERSQVALAQAEVVAHMKNRNGGQRERR